MKLKAVIRVSTLEGDVMPGEVFETDAKTGEYLLQIGAATELDGAQSVVGSFEKELNKLKVDELRHLAQLIELETDGLKKGELVRLLVEHIPQSELAELESLSAEEMRGYLGE